jgi:hypothetical protein
MHSFALLFVLCKPEPVDSESNKARRGDALLLSRSHVSVASGGKPSANQVVVIYDPVENKILFSFSGKCR